MAATSQTDSDAGAQRVGANRFFRHHASDHREGLPGVPSRIACWHAGWLLVLIGGELFYQSIRRVALSTGNLYLLPGMALVGSLIVPVSFVTFLAGRPAKHDVTLRVALVTALAGGCVSVAIAAGLEQLAIDHAILSPPLVGIVEETAKLTVTAVVLVWFIPGTARNGLIAGAACGAGFAVMETLGYVFVDYQRPNGGLPAVNIDLLERSLFAPATHLTWAALTGCALGFALPRLKRCTGLPVLLGTLGAVATMHALWDASTTPFAYPVLAALGLTGLAATLRGTRTPGSNQTATRPPDCPVGRKSDESPVTDVGPTLEARQDPRSNEES